MLIAAFIAAVLTGNLGWKEIVENIRKIKIQKLTQSIVIVVFWIAGIALALFLIFRLFRVIFWVVLLGLAVSLIKTLLEMYVIKK